MFEINDSVCFSSETPFIYYPCISKKSHTLIEIKEIVSYLFPFPPISKDLAFRLAVLIFAKTRFCSHIHFIGRCLHSKVIPKGFRSNFHTSSFSHSNQYRHQIQCAQNSFSRNIMRITIRAMCQKRNKLTEQILHCRSELSKICPAVLVQHYLFATPTYFIQTRQKHRQLFSQEFISNL